MEEGKGSGWTATAWQRGGGGVQRGAKRRCEGRHERDATAARRTCLPDHVMMWLPCMWHPSMRSSALSDTCVRGGLHRAAMQSE